MSKYIIYSAQTEAVNREQKVTDDAMFSDGYTTRYCDIIKHVNQDLWAVVIDKFYIEYFTQQEIDSAIQLDSSWTNPPFNIKNNIDGSNGVVFYNSIEMIPTNLFITEYAIMNNNLLSIELDYNVYNCSIVDTLINWEFATDLTTLYNTYLTLLP